MTRYIATGAFDKGGIGVVEYRQDTNLDRRVAVKWVPQANHRRLLDELAALQRVRSKHVVEIFDVTRGGVGSGVGVVEEFIEGRSLQEDLGKIRDKDEFVRLLFQMTSGLADIHAVEVIHRDVKPSNMLIDSHGILKYIDFNLARSESEAHTEGFKGTFGYAAPELYSRDPVKFSSKVDIYALGVTALALVKGPVLPKSLAQRPPDPVAWQREEGGFRGLNLAIDDQLLTLLDRCLSVSPSNRPTAADLVERCERVLLKGRHRARLVEVGTGAQLGEVSASSRKVRISSAKEPDRGFTIEYDGLEFKVSALDGKVLVNHALIAVGDVLPGCCVVELAGGRFVTVDTAHPEVVL